MGAVPTTCTFRAVGYAAAAGRKRGPPEGAKPPGPALPCLLELQWTKALYGKSAAESPTPRGRRLPLYSGGVGGGGPVHGSRRDGIGLTGQPDHGGRQGRLSVAADDLEVRLSKSVRVVGPNGPRAGREAPAVLPDGDGRISKSGPLPGRSKFILSFLDMYTLLLNFFSTFLQRCQF